MKKPIEFGKYYLLERINVGGMAEVFRAKAYGVEGFERLVAVKRILPNIAEDKDFIRMFVDEAKIAVQLTHANIAQIFDLGVEDGSYYISLEHIHGRDLRAIFDRCREYGQSMPVAQACFIIMKVCEGLDYAHNKRDQGGREIGLVHRDVSPQNLLVSFEGEVKIIDFGIAKAAGKGSKTQAGILKGKFGYMSPEQVRGLPIDRRSDVFSCGIVLYELLTGERLFVGESDFSTLEKVRNVEILPPSTYNPKIQPELERIVLRALSKDVEDRYQNAIDLHDELQAFVYTAGEFYSRKDLAAWMKRTFAREIEEETAKLESYRQMAPPELEPTVDGHAGMRNEVGGAGFGRRAATVPPPPPVARRAQAAGTMPPPAPPPPPQDLHAAAGGELEWDDDELETSIYSEVSRTDGPRGVRRSPTSAPPPAAALAPSALARSDGSEPDLSTLAHTARGWDPPQSGPPPVNGTGAPGQLPVNGAAAPGRLADGSNKSHPPLSNGQEPSAVVRLANMAAAQAAAEPIFDPTLPGPRGNTAPGRYHPTYVPPVRKRSPGLYVVVGAALLLVGAGIVTAVLMAGSKGDAPKAASAAPAAAPSEAEPAAAAAAPQAAAGGVVDPDTGFDLIVDPAGVEVKLDGTVMGKAPLQIHNLTEGEHLVEIEAPPGFFNKSQIVTVTRGEAERVVIELDAMEITATFASEPSGARVTLVSGGKRTELGRSPAEATLDPRKRYEVVFSKDGYVTATRPVDISGVPVFEVEVELAEARVAVKRAERDDSGTRPRREQPARDPVAALGSAESKAETKSEEKPARAAVTTTPKQSAATGTLMLGSKPPCRIFIDGRDTGEVTPRRDIELEAGRHRITLINNELGIKESFTVEIQAGKTTKEIKDLTGRLGGR